MASEILINVRPSETHVAYIENGVLNDLKIEQKTSPTLVGSVHRGKVLRVLPGMQAAFVDIGLDRAAFLYVGDVRPNLDGDGSELLSGDLLGGDHEHDDVAGESGVPVPVADSADRPKIQDLLTEGQWILVQVAKDPLGTKGARITTHISLPGRHVVYLPTLNHRGVSRRIEEGAERDRLRDIVNAIDPKGGVIVRTAGEGATEASLRNDLDYLNRLWQDVQKAYEKRTKPGLVHAEPDVELRALRDSLSDEVDRVVIDDEETFKKILAFLGQFMPRYKNKVTLYSEDRPIFDQYEIDLEISRSLERKIWLKSGGYIVVDEAEALVVIDVNTGRYVGKRDLEDTILKTNLEAVREIAHQLRIRNCGGIIIIDFIDMEKEAHREKILESLREELVRDRAKTTVVAMSNLGLVEMTRKRIRPSLVKTLCEPCSHCDGKAYVKTKSTVSREIFRDLEREGAAANSEQVLVVHCHAEIGDHIYAEETEALEDVERRVGQSVVFKLEPSFHREQYEIFRSGPQASKTN